MKKELAMLGISNIIKTIKPCDKEYYANVTVGMMWLVTGFCLLVKLTFLSRGH